MLGQVRGVGSVRNRAAVKLCQLPCWWSFFQSGWMFWRICAKPPLSRQTSAECAKSFFLLSMGVYLRPLKDHIAEVTHPRFQGTAEVGKTYIPPSLKKIPSSKAVVVWLGVSHKYVNNFQLIRQSGVGKADHCRAGSGRSRILSG